MISQRCDFKEFIDAVENTDYYHVIRLADQEATSAERMFFRFQRTADGGARCGERYACLLKEFIYYLRHGVRPTDISDEDFTLFENVRNGFFLRETLKYQ